MPAQQALDYAVTGGAFLFYSMPMFWLALLLIIVFSIDLRWFPPEAPQGDADRRSSADPPGLVLPVVTLALVTIAAVQPVHALLGHRQPDPGLRAHRPGQGACPRRELLRRHVLRNSLLPDRHADRPDPAGHGQRGADHRERVQLPRHGPAVLERRADRRTTRSCSACTVVVGVATVVGSLLADLLYAVVDPRVRIAER